MSVDRAKVIERMTQLNADAEVHKRAADILYGLADDEEREADRIHAQAAKVKALLDSSDQGSES